jgi:signal transduction histidine kinase
VVGREVVETASALIALLAALLVVGRYHSSAKLRDLALVQAFVVLAVANLLPNVLPSLVAAGPDAPALRGRLFLVGGLIAALSLAIAALAGQTQLERRTLTPAFAGLVGVAAPIVGLVLVDGFRVGPTSATARSVHVVAAVLFAVAGVALASRRNGRDAAERDRLRPFLAAGSLVAAAGRLSLAVAPGAVIADRAHPADLLRLAFYAILLAGAIEEVRSYWQRMAVLEERRRLARDIHDGVAQELAFIATEAVRREPRPDQLERIASSAKRALDESRRAISALTRPLDQSLEEAVAEAASEVALRGGMALRLDLERGVSVHDVAREQLVRIVREALTNAVNHAHATSVHVELRRSHDVITVRVIDDGIGFDESAGTPRGRIGLVSMRERAAGLGAELVLSSAPGAGTEVEIRLPCPS